jgi:hypothetical protein
MLECGEQLIIHCFSQMMLKRSLRRFPGRHVIFARIEVAIARALVLLMADTSENEPEAAFVVDRWTFDRWLFVGWENRLAAEHAGGVLLHGCPDRKRGSVATPSEKTPTKGRNGKRKQSLPGFREFGLNAPFLKESGEIQFGSFLLGATVIYHTPFQIGSRVSEVVTFGAGGQKKSAHHESWIAG